MFPLLKNLFQADTVINQLSQIENHGVGSLLSAFSKNHQLQKIDLYNQAKFQHWLKISQNVFEQFHQARLPFLVLKGFAHSFQFYEETHLRPYSDIDVFIPKKDLSKAVHILRSLGYTQLNTLQGELISQQNSFSLNDRFHSTIDLHWQINNKEEFYLQFPFSSVQKKAVTVNSNAGSFQTLNHCDSMLLSCFHYFGHKPNDRKHIWLYDMALNWLSMSEKQQQDCLHRALQVEISQMLHQGLLTLSQTFAGMISVPEKFKPQSNEPSAIYIAKGSSFKIRLKNTRGGLRKARLLKEYLFPNRNYLVTLFQTKSSRWVWLSLPRYWWRALFK